ncbi:uncharacterized protein LOC144630581 isoform X1 [Oculina patagonica]
MGIPDEEVNGVLTGYVVSYQAVKVGGENVVDKDIKKKRVGADTTSLILDDLQSFTTYEIKVAGLTRRGEGVFSKVAYEETCHCEKRLTTNYWFYPPYVISSPTNNMSGIFMVLLDKMVQHCCGDCHNGHGKFFVDYSFDGNHNLSKKDTKHDMVEVITHLTDLNFPVHGYSDQRTYLGTYKYVPVVESPGAAFIVRYDSLDAPITNALVKSWPLAVVIVVFVLLSGILYWILDCSENPGEVSRTFPRGLWEGIWWSFITTSTVGYGDRTPRSFLAKCLAMVWMLTGCIVFPILTSCLISGLTVLSLDDSNLKLYGMKVAALYDSPEYYLAVRRNAKVNARNYTRLAEIKEDLLSGEVKGALIDTYVVAARHDLFHHEFFRIHELIDYRSSFGVVLGGNSVRLQQCFLDYLKNEKSLLTSLVDNYTDTLEHTETSRAEQVATGMFDSSDSSYQTNVIALSAILAAAVLCGVMYEVWKRSRRNKRVEDEETRKMLVRKDKLIQEMSQLLEEFYNNMSTKYTELTTRHKKEWQLLLKIQWKERKSRFPKERKQKDKFEEQDTRRRKHKKLFLDDTAC